MADAWNGATPVNANTVKDTVPDEFQALKYVNINRIVYYGTGGQNEPYTGVWDGSQYTTGITIRFVQALLQGGATYDNATGELTVGDTGWYRVNCNGYNDTFTNGAGFLIVQLYTGGAWVTRAQVLLAQENTALYQQSAIDCLILCTAGEKIRTQLYLFASFAFSGTFSAVSGTIRQTVEFVKAT